MRGLTMRNGREATGRGGAAEALIRLALLWCLRERADGVHLGRCGDAVELAFRRGREYEPLLPPPRHVVGDAVRLLARLRPVRERWASWWRDRRHGRVPTAFAGECPLSVGSAAGVLRFSVLPHAGGVLIALRPDCGADGCEQATAVLAGWPPRPGYG